MKTKKTKYLALLIIFAVAAIITVLLILLPAEKEKVIDTSDWETYTNLHYGFEIKHPSDWLVKESPANKVAPMYNIYKPGSDKSKLPYDHHTEGVTHVSVYPLGIPAEGVFGVYRKSEIKFSIPVKEAEDYILDDGKRWATIVKFKNPPSTWDKKGFIFSHVEIRNLKAECIRGAEKISNQECSPLFGDTVVRQGMVDDQDIKITSRIMESFSFVEKDERVDNSYKDLIRIDHPIPESSVSSPLKIVGEARGNWYFEGNFPVVLTDWDGKIIATGVATAQDEWMTMDYVPYEATLKFDVDTAVSDRGSLILQKNNASGLPEHEDAFEFFVFFEAISDK